MQHQQRLVSVITSILNVYVSIVDLFSVSRFATTGLAARLASSIAQITSPDAAVVTSGGVIDSRDAGDYDDDDDDDDDSDAFGGNRNTPSDSSNIGVGLLSSVVVAPLLSGVDALTSAITGGRTVLGVAGVTSNALQAVARTCQRRATRATLLHDAAMSLSAPMCALVVAIGCADPTVRARISLPASSSSSSSSSSAKTQEIVTRDCTALELALELGANEACIAVLRDAELAVLAMRRQQSSLAISTRPFLELVLACLFSLCVCVSMYCLGFLH